MKWFGLVCAVAAIGGVFVAPALIVRWLERESTSSVCAAQPTPLWLARGQAQTMAEAQQAAAAVFAQSQTELLKAVGQIQQEFGRAVSPDAFESHHAARDLLQRLRLAQQAARLGVDMDAEDYGDGEHMRRQLDALRQGVTMAGRMLDQMENARNAQAGPSPQAAAAWGHAAEVARVARGIPAGNPATPDRDHVFIRGQRYYRDENGAYVRDDGNVLPVTNSTGGRGAKTGGGSPRPAAADNPLADVLPQLESVLEMLAPKADSGS